MTLTDEETREAAVRLWRATFPTDHIPPRGNVLEDVVRRLAAQLPEHYAGTEDRETAVRVFMLWMGDAR